MKNRFGARCRCGMSLVELLLSLVILSMGLTSIFGALSASRDQVGRMDVLLCGRWLAQSVLDQTVHRARTRDMRYFKLNSAPADFVAGARSGHWKQAFQDLEQGPKRVVDDSGKPGPYFDPQSGPAWPEHFEAAEIAFWQGFTYEVLMATSVALEAGGPEVGIDSDGDGRAETDLVRVDVEIRWAPVDGSAAVRSVCKLTTMLGSWDKAPGEGAFADE